MSIGSLSLIARLSPPELILEIRHRILVGDPSISIHSCEILSESNQIEKNQKSGPSVMRLIRRRDCDFWALVAKKVVICVEVSSSKLSKAYSLFKGPPAIESETRGRGGE